MPRTNAKVADSLSKVLADSYTLYMKTHGFHWNVEGPFFATLHELFGAQYNEIWTAIDEIAERIRALGAYPPGSGSAMVKIASIDEARGIPSAKAMVSALLDGHRTIAKTITVAMRAAQAAGDEATADLMIERLDAHDKHAWMLASTLKGWR
jgi:starvation-inducible DNA-binding protein